MWSPGVCLCVMRRGEVTHEGHSSGQHQLLKCEVQPQAKASLPVGANLTLLHTHSVSQCLTHTCLLSSKHHAVVTLMGLPFALGELLKSTAEET